MRKLLNYIIIFVLFIPYSFGAENSDYYEEGYARMSYVQGDVFIQRAEDLGYEEGVVNLALIQGDKIGTREGRTEIHIGEGNYIRIDRDTQIELVRMPDRSEDVTGIHLLSGNIFLRVNFLSDEKFMEVHTPDTSLYILEEGLYYLTIKQGKQTEIRIFEGGAEAAGEEGSLLLGDEEKLIVSNGRFITNATRFYPSMNTGFAEWNSSRDAFHNRYAGGTRYLPSELNEYEAELNHYGQWRYHNSHGYVWIPSGISISWRPYYHGRWVWYPIIGWTWVSYEPWGWCVSHYGRWHWSVRLGWYWIPTSRWGPAWVHWYHGPSYIGWSPLSYYGYPGVVINNHYYGNYYHNYYPSGSSALTVVRKDQLQARNVSKVALSKSSVSKLSQISMSSKQPTIRPVVNKAGLRTSEAAQLFSKANNRPVTKSYSATHAIKTSPRSKTRSSLTREKISNTRRSSNIKTYPSRETRNVARSSSHSRSMNSSSSIRRPKTSTSINSRSSRQSSQIRRYPSRTSSSKSKANSFSNVRSTKARSSIQSRTRNTSSSSLRSSIRNRSVPRASTSIKSRSVPRVSNRANSRSINSSTRKPTSSSRIRSSSPSRIRSSSSSRITSRISSSSRPKAGSSSRTIRSSSSRARSSSSVKSTRTTRTKSSSRSSSTKRVKKK
ncbi:MAG: DUF6600 domain-containing protein [Acidobacteriota bacterium]